MVSYLTCITKTCVLSLGKRYMLFKCSEGFPGDREGRHYISAPCHYIMKCSGDPRGRQDPFRCTCHHTFLSQSMPSVPIHGRGQERSRRLMAPFEHLFLYPWVHRRPSKASRRKNCGRLAHRSFSPIPIISCCGPAQN